MRVRAPGRMARLTRLERVELHAPRGSRACSPVWMTFKQLSRTLAVAIALLGPSVVLAAPDSGAVKAAPVAPQPVPGKLTDSDLTTMGHVHAVNLMEIDMGKLAQKNGTTAGVKAFGATLVKDHTAADKDLAALAKKRGAVIPKDKPADDGEAQQQKDDMAQMTKLKATKGAELERGFLAMMITGHERELAKLDTAIGKTTDDELGGFLRGIKPVIQGHATAARDLQNAAPQASK